MGATCSAVISAACHQPLPDDKDAYKFAVQWGAVAHQKMESEKGEDAASHSEAVTVSASTRIARAARQDTVENVSRIEPGHCCFTTARDVDRPRVGETYM
jgi:hypothetical protein